MFVVCVCVSWFEPSSNYVRKTGARAHNDCLCYTKTENKTMND